MNGLYDNSGNIKITNSFYGDGILIKKSYPSDNAWETLKLEFITVTYKTFS